MRGVMFLLRFPPWTLDDGDDDIDDAAAFKGQRSGAKGHSDAEE